MQNLIYETHERTASLIEGEGFPALVTGILLALRPRHFAGNPTVPQSALRKLTVPTQAARE